METTEKNRTPIRTYKDLNVWNASMELVCEVYDVTKGFPDSEQYGLTSQMRRCSVSLPSNIAEGWSRNASRSFTYYLTVAAGSLFELLTQIEISSRLNYIGQEKKSELELKGIQIAKMLFMLIKKVESRSKNSQMDRK